MVSCSNLEDIRKEVAEDPTAQDIIQKLRDDPSSMPHYHWDSTDLHYKHRIFLPSSSKQKLILLQEFHSSPTAGHSGFLRTYKRISQVFHWKGMKNEVKKFVEECATCQANKGETVASPGLLQPLPIPEHIWTDISMDFIDGLPPAHGKTTILVVVDRLSKYAHFCPISHPYTAASIAQVFVDNIIKLHGVPRSIVSDRDPIFTSNFWKELFRLQGTQLKMSTAYHPQSDGQTEVVNRCVENYLRCFVGDRPKEWVRWLPWAEWWYNTTYHSSTKITPFEAVYGRPPPAMSNYSNGSSKVHQVNCDLRDRNHVLHVLKNNLQNAQSRMKQQADKHRTERSFEVGDWVYLRLQPYKQASVSIRASMKLSPRFYGPYKVIERIGPVAYRLNLPAESKIHPVFHVSCLKKKLGDQVTAQRHLPELSSSGEIKFLPQAILDRRFVKHRNRAATEVLVQWANLPIEDATWESYQSFAEKFPEFIAAQP